MRIAEGRMAQEVARPAMRAGGSTTALFRLPTDGAAATAHTAMASSLAGLDSLFSVQQAGDSLARRQRKLSRGHRLLDDLEALKLETLGAGASLATLQRLKGSLASARDHAADPELDDLLAAVELRAAVELAKRGA
jgi:Class II flagellar assembly regulator